MKWSWQAKIAVLGCVFFVIGLVVIFLVGGPWSSPLLGYRSHIVDIAVSPDRSKIAFTFYNNLHAPLKEETALFVVNSDGTNLRLLDKQNTENGVLHSVSWSSNSQVIQYEGGLYYGKPAYFSINTDSSNRQELAELRSPKTNITAYFWERYCSPVYFGYECDQLTVRFYDNENGNYIFTVKSTDLLRPNIVASITLFILSSIAFLGVIGGPALSFPWLLRRRHPFAILVMFFILGAYITIGFFVSVLIQTAD